MVEYLKQLKEFCHIISKNLFGGLLLLFALALMFLMIESLVKKSGRTNVFASLLQTIMIPCVFYILILSKITVYLDQRYVFPIYAVLYAAMFAPLTVVLKRYMKDSVVVACVVGISFVSLALAYVKPDFLFLYRDNSLPDVISENYADLDSIVLTNSDWRCVTLYKIVTDTTTFSYENDYSPLYANGLIYDEEAIIYALDEIQAQMLVQEMPNVDSYEPIGGHLYFTAYHVY